jgi:hypothetical protein
MANFGGGKTLKKLLLLAFGLVSAFTFSACGSDNNDMTNSNDGNHHYKPCTG